MAVSGVHMLADLFSNVLPPLLPAVRQHFRLSLFEGSILVVVLLLSSNWLQLVAGYLRSHTRDRWFMYIGLVLASAVTAMGLVPQGSGALWWLCGLAAVTGAGIAMVHPDALRAVHGLDRLPGSVATGGFMASGFAGYAIAGWVSTSLVQRWGLIGLPVLALLPLVGILGLWRMRIRPALETRDEGANLQHGQVPFWMVMAMAIPAGIAMTTFGTLLPTRLVDELGFDLRFGGLSAAVYGMGGAIGSVLWAMAANRLGDLLAAVLAMAVVGPSIGLYLLFMNRPATIVLLFVVGFFSFAAYILLVAVAKSAKGASLSMRMAWIVGGTWGVSNLAFLGLARLADVYGTLVVMAVSPAGYLVAVAFGWFILRRSKVLEVRCSQDLGS